MKPVKKKSILTTKAFFNRKPKPLLGGWVNYYKKKYSKQVRKPIQRVSVARAKRLVEYEKVKKAHLKEYPLCRNCCGSYRVSIHHSFGRIHNLLTEKRLFITLCEPCHDWVHKYPEKAREKGLIAPMGHWNKSPFKKGK